VRFKDNTIPDKKPRVRTKRNRSKPQNQLPDGDGVNQSAATSQPRPPRRRNPAATSDNTPVSSSSIANDTTRPRASQPPRRRNPTNANTTATTDPNATTATTSQNRPLKEGTRRSRFGAGLTQPEPTESTTSHSTSRRNKGKKALPSSQEGDDLISILIRGLSSAPYHDCPICFSAIRPDQAIWSCSPSSPLIQNEEHKPSQYCWTSFHVKCIHSWADKSVKEVAEAWRARGEPDKKGDWRCPGCQAKRDIVPSGYW
jgi:transcriptional repressor NF-X1